MKSTKLILIILPFILAFYSGDENNNKKGSNLPENTPVALVKKIVKDVTFRKASDVSEWESAKTGLPLYDGGEVKTGFKSLALIFFTDNSGILRVRENSILHIYGERKDKSMNKNTFVQKGLIGFDVRKQGEDEEFKFTTPTVVASIRGTDGFLEYDEDSTFTMSLNSGFASLQYVGTGGCTDSLSAGSTIIINANGVCDTREQNDDDLNKSNLAQGSEVKKIRINTNKGKVEIQYYAPKN